MNIINKIQRWIKRNTDGKNKIRTRYEKELRNKIKAEVQAEQLAKKRAKYKEMLLSEIKREK